MVHPICGLYYGIQERNISSCNSNLYQQIEHSHANHTNSCIWCITHLHYDNHQKNYWLNLKFANMNRMNYIKLFYYNINDVIHYIAYHYLYTNVGEVVYHSCLHHHW